MREAASTEGSPFSILTFKAQLSFGSFIVSLGIICSLFTSVHISLPSPCLCNAVVTPCHHSCFQNSFLVSSTPPASLLGSGYPPAVDLTSNSSVVSSAWSNFSDTINSYIRANQTLEDLVPDLGSYSFSVGRSLSMTRTLRRSSSITTQDQK